MNPTQPISKLAIFSLLLMLFLSAIETTILTTAMPQIIPALGGQHLYHWVFTAYMIASTVVTPFYGKLADRIGIRSCMLFAVGTFLVGSLLCGFSQNMIQLISFRALQGIGAAGLTGLTMISFGVLFSAQERGSKQALTSTVWGIACLAGPTIGGLIVTFGSWRWIFWMNLPLGLLGTVIFYLTFPKQKRSDNAHPFDWKGSMLLFPMVILLMFCLSIHATWIWIGYGLILALFIAFVRQERKAPDPMIPLHFFKHRSFNIVLLIAFASNITMFTALTYIPYYLQEALKYSPVESGYVLTPMIVFWPLCSAISGMQANRLGFRTLIVLGCGLMLFGNLFWAFPPADTPLWAYAFFACFLGAGMGTMNAMTIILIQVIVKNKEIGSASATLNLFRNIGSALGVNTLGALQVSLLGQFSMAESIIVVFQVLAGVTVVYFLAGFFLPNKSPAELSEEQG